MRQAHHQFKVYSDLKVLVLIHLNHLSSVTLRGKCSSLWHRHNRCSEWWNFLFSGFQLTASSSFKMTRTVSSASNIACFIMRKANLKKIEKKKTPKEGFILDLSELMRSVRIVSIARKLSLWKTDFHPFSSKSEIRSRKWFWYVYCYLHEGKKSFKTINGDVSIRDWLIHNVRNKKQNNFCFAGPYAFSDTNNG